jgi:hypothetical protein
MEDILDFRFKHDEVFQETQGRRKREFEGDRARRKRTDQHRINPQSCLSWSRCDTSRHKETSLFRGDGSASSADTRALVALELE